MRKIKQGRGSPDKTLGAPLDKRQGLLAVFFLWSVGDGVQDCCSCSSVGPGWSDAGCNKHQSGCTVVQGQGFFTCRIGQKRCHLCSMCSRRAEGAGEGRSVSVPTGPAPVCVSCAAATYWDGGLGIPALLLLSHQGSTPGSAWPLPSLCLPPSGQQPQLLMEALAGRQQHPGASSSAQLSSALLSPRCRQDPAPCSRPAGTTHPCVKWLPTGSLLIWHEWRALWFGRDCQNGPRQRGFGREEALGWEMVVKRNLDLSQAPALTAPSPYPSAPREGRTEEGSPYTNLSQRILAWKVALDKIHLLLK